MIRALLFFFFIATSAQAFTANEEGSNFTIYPVEYDITIMPYIIGDVQDGGHCYYVCHMTIKVISFANINVIEMDAIEMDIKGESIEVKVPMGNHSLVDKYTYNEDRGKLTINLKESLKPFKDNQYYFVKMSFKKYVSVDSPGVFLVRYFDEVHNSKYIIQTRLSPSLAKYFIPCFENPHFQSVFKLTVYLDPKGDKNNQLQYTNTSIFISEHTKEELLYDKRLVINYATSPKVRLSQVAFHHSQFGYIKTTSKYTNDTIIVWAPAFKLKNCDYILNYGEEILSFFRDYSLLNHESSKVERPFTSGPINIIAIPTKLRGYEIDSWNVLTNSEIRIIYNHKYSSIQQIERMNFELAQQLSRVWLGNPGEPTMTRWREEWFKEGLATYLAYCFMTQHNHGKGSKSSSNVESIRQLNYYGFQMKYKAMFEDWHHTNDLRPLLDFNNELAVNINSKELWKQLVTMKTASLLWMVENWIGSKRFHESLVKYINNKRGTEISLQDFMNQLDQDTVDCFKQSFSGINTSKVLMSWFTHSGYPVISVQVIRNNTPNIIELKQTRFSFTGQQSRESNYLIPISYLIEKKSNCNNCYQPQFTISRPTHTFVENLNNGWIILNTNASGYYRVNYDKYTWELIAKMLKNNPFTIGELNRAQIVNDVFALYVSGDMSQDLAMKILDYLDQEISLTVWESVLSGFEMLKIENAGCEMTKLIYSEWQRFLSKKLERYNWICKPLSRDSRETRLFRSKIVELALAIRDQTCSEQLYSHWLGMNKTRVVPDLRAASYYVAYEAFKNSFTKTDYNFNDYENEDRETAIKYFVRDDLFLDKLPKGEPRPANIVMPSNPVNVYKGYKGSAESLPVTFYLLSISILVSSVLNVITDIN
ncbi:hypothetical protein ABMA28_001148 [Loxostege sticticalis]|uniref:Aminopeptidase n=1 Tax=Loxostege sticticalis TaxID=481309 RepID=A0ABD0T571_LOXSC